MMGEKEPKQPMFFYVTLEGLVPEDHFLRKVLQVVDFSFIRSKVKHLYSHTGKPSIDPVVLIKIMLIGYLYGILSERQLMEEIQVNLAYRYFIGYTLEEDIPDHSTLSRNRNERFKDSTFQEIFDEVVLQCISYGLVSSEHLSIDSTIVEANASLSSLTERKVLLGPDEYIKKVTLENPVEEEENPSSKHEQSEPDKPKKKKLSNKDYVSTTDSESSIIRKPGRKTMLAYSDHIVADTKSNIITGVLATPAQVSDNQVMTEILKRSIKRFGLEVLKVSADKKYGTGKNLKVLSELGIEAFIPIQEYSNKKGLFGQDKFIYNSEQDTFTCPSGKELKFFRYAETKETKRYKAEGSDCLSCPLREKCTTAKNGRTVNRSIYQELIDEAKDRMDTPQGRRAARLRMTTSETINAEAKTWHGLSRSRYRGLARVQIQFLMTATAQNIKRMVNLVMRKKAETKALVARGKEFVANNLLRSFCLQIFNCQGAVEVS